MTTDAKERIAAIAQGNPLFVEELLGMLIDDGWLASDGSSWVQTGDISVIAIPPRSTQCFPPVWTDCLQGSEESSSRPRWRGRCSPGRP